MGQTDIGCRVPLMQELPTLRTIGEVNNRYRDIRDLFIPIDSLVDKRIRKRGDDEDDRHSRISEDALQFRNERVYYL